MSVSVPGSRTTTAPAGSSREQSARSFFRPEVEGLRAVAVLLVVVYHIWFGRVSGGVDVFLLLTGFFITGSLLRSVERHGRVMFWQFWTRLARRLIPMAAVALAGVMVAAFVFLPRSRWEGILAEVRAAALYHQNWELADKAVDYLAREEAVGPVQHFWSLSIQGQFYVVWPLLFAVVAFFAARGRWGLRFSVGVVIAVVGVTSLAYSVWITGQDQAWAYFDTGARLWEFALGGLVALVIPRVVLPGRLRVLLGWVGLVGLVGCGLVLQVSTLFPGWVALWPTGAAVLVIVAGTTGSRFGADRLLTWKPLVGLGRVSYGWYLWHWPVLVCYLHVTDRVLAGVVGGVLVLGVSLGLAWCAHRWVEGAVEHLARVRPAPGRSLGIAASFLVPLLAGSLLWSGHLGQQQRLRAELADEPASYPGALTLSDPQMAAGLQDLPVLPDPVDAKEDLSDHHAQGCHVNLTSTDLVVCDVGPEDAEHTLAMVGASRVAHWYPAVQEVAEEHDWRLVSFTKSGCQFSTDVATRDGAEFTECQEWDAKAVEKLEELSPDAVLTSSTTANPSGERLPDGFVERWEHLGDLGIDVIGIRDLPRRDYQTAECVERGIPQDCTSPSDYSQASEDPAQDRADLPSHVTTFDLTDYVCPEGRCDAVVGNVLVFWDHSHMTATYARTLTPMMEQALRGATGW